MTKPGLILPLGNGWMFSAPNVEFETKPINGLTQEFGMSQNWKNKLYEEVDETDKRLEKLREVIGNRPSTIPEKQIDLMIIQSRILESYLSVLEHRVSSLKD